MRELGWFERGKGATTNELKALESELGITFPSDVAIFLEKCAGASNPDESEFEIIDAFGRRCIGNFGAVLNVSLGSPDGINAAIVEVEGLPINVIPIVATGSGDFVCLHYQSRDPVIAYYFHGRSSSENLVLLARTFSQFLAYLRVPEDD